MSPQQWYQDAAWLQWRGHPIPYKYQRAPGRPVVLTLHGFPTASWDWYKMWPALTAQFEVIAFDLIGFGWAAKPVDYQYSLLDQADLSQALLGELGIDRCHLLAHDYGDSVAQELLARQHDGTLEFAVDRCVLLNGGIIPGVHRPRLTQKLLLTPLGPLVGALLSERRLGRIFARIFGPDTPPSAAELAACWQLIEHNQGRRIAHKLIRYMAERKHHYQRWVGVLSEPPVPIRLINGLHDPISGAHLVEAYRQLNPAADVVELTGIGHYPQLEAPDRVGQAVIEFLGATV